MTKGLRRQEDDMRGRHETTCDPEPLVALRDIDIGSPQPIDFETCELPSLWRW